jgi:integrase
MNFVQKTSEHSNRILRDIPKIAKIIDALDEPYDIAARLEWETACRVGAVMKLNFAVNLSEPQNTNICRGINDGLLNRSEFINSQDDFWKDTNGYCFVKLKEKRGHVLERVITEELYQWLHEWKAERIFMIRQMMEKHYNEREKLRFKLQLNTRMFPYSLNTYNTMLHRAAFKNGITKFSSHWFRGTRITYLLQKGINMRNIQMLVGHKNISTTERYAQPDVNSTEELDKYLEITKDSLKMEKA